MYIGARQRKSLSRRPIAPTKPKPPEPEFGPELCVLKLLALCEDPLPLPLELDEPLELEEPLLPLLLLCELETI